MEKLTQTHKLIEEMISKTPTGDLRNSLTDVNILILVGMDEIIHKNIELLKVINS